MRKLILIALIIISGAACKAQNKFDLQKPIYGVDPRTNYLKDKKKEGDAAELMTSLPVYTTTDMQGFTFGPLSFTNGGQLGADDIEPNSVGFMVKSVQERVLVGLIIDIEKVEEAKKLAAYVTQKYGKSEVLARTPKPDKGIMMGHSAYLWKNFQPGVSMVMVEEFSTKANKQATATKLYILQTDTKPNPKLEGFKTVLDKIVQGNTNHISN